MNQEYCVKKAQGFALQHLWVALTQWLLRGYSFFSAVRKKVQDDALSLRAMGLTYVTLLSLVPLLAVMFAVLKAFGVHNLMSRPWFKPWSRWASRGLKLPDVSWSCE